MEYIYLDDTKNITDLFDNNLNSENINNKTKNSEIITNKFTEDIKIINLEKQNLNKNINYDKEEIDKILNFIKNFFNSQDELKGTKLYLDNKTSINYIFNIKTPVLNIYSIFKNDKIYLMLNKIKFYFLEFKNKTNDDKFKLKFILSNNFFYQKNNTNLSIVKIVYLSINSNYIINIYFFDNENFYKDQNFKNLISNFNSTCNLDLEENKINFNKYSLIDLYYQINNNAIYCINKVNGLLENIDLHNLIENLTINDIFFEKNPFIILEIIIYFLQSNIIFYKKVLIEFNELYLNNKNLKKKIKNLFDFEKIDYLTKIINFFNTINEFCLDYKFFDFNEEFPLFKKILFGINNFNCYSISINNISTYLKLLFINKFKIISKDFINYSNIFFKNNLINYIKNDNANINNLDIIINNNKFLIYKKLKKNKFIFINILNQYNNVFFYEIKIFFEIITILFYAEKKLNINIESLKLAYIFKKYYNIDHVIFNNIFKFYNNILKFLDYDYSIENDNYFYKLLYNNNIISYEIKLINNLPNVKNKFEIGEDNIDIYDYQDSICFVYELFYLGNIDLKKNEILQNLFYEYFEAILANLRGNNLLNKNIDFYKKILNNELDLENNVFPIITDEINKINNLNLLNILDGFATLMS
jgi:hypothetical protein